MSSCAAVRSALERRDKLAHHDAHTAEVRVRIRSLSERERQVLDGLVAGKANKVIAYDLGISPERLRSTGPM